MANEYYALINQDCYAPSIVGRKLSQEEVDRVVEICDNYDEGNWGEEHLIQALKEIKNELC